MPELTIDARAENLDYVLDFVNEQLDRVCCPSKIKVKIDIAVEEIFVNIAHYSYGPSTGTVSVRIEINEQERYAELTFSDEGIPYDPLQRSDPDTTLSAEQRQIGGLGIYMVKKSMDKVQYKYQDRKNILTLKKKI